MVTSNTQSANKQIFFWHGENDYEISTKIAYWVGLFEKKYSNLNIIYFDLAESKQNKGFLADVKNALQVDSLFGSNKLIVFRSFIIPNKKIDEEVEELILRMLEKLAVNFVLVFIQKEKPDARTKVYKKLVELQKQGKAEIEEFHLPKDATLSRWIMSEVKKNQAEIEPTAASLLAATVGNDLWQLAQEITKLANYKRGEKIANVDVTLLVKGKFNDDIFQLMDAISEKNKKRALKLFSDQLDSGANEIYLLTMLTRQFRILWQVKDLLKEQNMPSEEVAKRLKIHPYVAKRTMIFIKNFSLDELKKIYATLLDFDIKIKTGKASFDLLFDMLIVKMK